MKKIYIAFIRSHTIGLILTGLVTTGLLCPFTTAGRDFDKQVQWSDWTPKVGGCGGIFFNAEAGHLVIEFEKTDLDPSRESVAVRVVLASPDRKVIVDRWIREGEDSPGQKLRLETNVDRPGIYILMITASYDRYGEKFSWRFRSNCQQYMIETSRGHRDAFHEEPIVLLNPEMKTEICFLPQDGEFNIVVSSIDKSLKRLFLKNVTGHTVAQADVVNDSVVFTIPAGSREAVPWQLHFPKAQGKIEIEGVTNWGPDAISSFFDQYLGGAIWSPDLNSWFDLHANRWLITPFNRKTYGQAGQEKSATFTIHNNSAQPENVNLALEFPEKSWKVNLSDTEMKLAPNEEREITLSWNQGEGDEIVYVRATRGGYSTFSALHAKSGFAPVDSAISLPLVLKPYAHEHEQFGYSPDYPLENQLYFNVDNTPFVRTNEGISALQHGQWKAHRIGKMTNSIVAFDADGDVYTLGIEDNRTVLLHSTDHGKTFTAYPIPGDLGESRYDIEQFSGHNALQGPPPITRFTRKVTDNNIFWRRYGDIELLIPKKTENGIEWEEPILISDKCLGVSSHSGIPSSIVSWNSKIFLCWGEASDPEVGREKIPGVPVYVTSYDRSTGKMEEPELVGFGEPPNDVHNIPGITIDGSGHLHVLTGTHGRPFQYSRSLIPEDVTGGWTKAEPVMNAEGSRSTQTYIGLVVDQNNTLHLVFRLWRYNTEYFPDDYFASLAYMSKKAGKPWSEPQLLVVAPFSQYSIYRHRLTIDRSGRMFLSYYYWSTYWFYRNDRKIQRRVLMSSDGGENWKLAENRAFLKW